MKQTRWAALLLGGILGMGDGLAWAQVITLTPSLTISEEYDDNILLSSTDRQSDFVTSVTPGVRLAIKEAPWDVTLEGSARGDYYTNHSELDSSFTHYQNGSLAVTFRPTPRLTASLTDTYSRSVNSAEVDVETGITTGRFTTYGNTVASAVSYQTTPLTTVGLRYSFGIFRSDSTSTLTQDQDAHEAGLSVEHQFTPGTSGSLRYTFSLFQVEGTPDQDAHSPLLGLAHAFSPTMRVSAAIGPVFLKGADDSEVTVAGTLRYEQDFKQGRFSLGYDRSAGAAGFTGVVGVRQGITATATYTPARDLTLALDSGVRVTDEVGTSEEVKGAFLTATATYTPARDLTLALESGVRVTDSVNRVEDFLIYEGGVRVDYRILQWLSMNASYRHTRQDDKTGTNDLERNVVFIGLTASTDVRVY